MNEDAKPAPDGPTGKPCPICRKPAIYRYRPFCSKRCGDIDLQRWFVGGYAIPAAADDREESEARPPDEED